MEGERPFTLLLALGTRLGGRAGGGYIILIKSMIYSDLKTRTSFLPL